MTTNQTRLQPESNDNDGSVWCAPAREHIYTEAAKEAEERAKAAHHAEWRRSRFSLLGDLPAEFTRNDVMCAFRIKAREHHPDCGGDPAAFRELVALKDVALREARQ
jgi:hypothetical protein